MIQGFYFSPSEIYHLMSKVRFAYSAVHKEGDKEALSNLKKCDMFSGMNLHGLLLCCSSSFQKLVVTEEKKWGQNSVKFILFYSLIIW